MATPVDPVPRFLANIAWHCLEGAHARHARVSGEARRYAQGLVAGAAFRHPSRPDLDGLADLVEPDEVIGLFSVEKVAHPAWKTQQSRGLVQMVRGLAQRYPGPGRARQLGMADAPAVQALVHGQPVFTPAMMAVGEHWGMFEDGLLVAVAATRLVAGGYREISTVHTHPDFRRRGLAGRLVTELADRMARQGSRAFLHVEADNIAAQRVYARCGFTPVQVVPLTVVQRLRG